MTISLDDARQRWQDAVVVISGSPVFVKGISIPKDGKKHFVLDCMTINNRGAWEMESIACNFSEVNEALPTLGNIQTGVVAHRLSRKVTRQFQRGLVPGQISSCMIGPGDILGSQITRVPMWNINGLIVSPMVIKAIYNREYTPFMEAVRKVSSGTALSVAISPDLALVAGASRWPLLYYKTLPVGKIQGDVALLEKPAACLRELVQQHSPLHVAVR